MFGDVRRVFRNSGGEAIVDLDLRGLGVRDVGAGCAAFCGLKIGSAYTECRH